jgi:hypothetical protein
LASGQAGSHAVYAGEKGRWPGFQIREGYWVTRFLDSTPYAMGNDSLAMAIVSDFRFISASLIAAGFVLLGRLCVRRCRRHLDGRTAD